MFAMQIMKKWNKKGGQNDKRNLGDDFQYTWHACKHRVLSGKKQKAAFDFSDNRQRVISDFLHI